MRKQLFMIEHKTNTMTNLNPQKLFSIFEQGDEEVYEEHGVEMLLSNPYVLINMVGRGMENFELMERMYLKRYPEEYEKVRAGVKKTYYARLYGYLTRIDIKDIEDTYSIGDAYDVTLCSAALDDLRQYYEEQEEYLKCATIRDFIEYLFKK